MSTQFACNTCEEIAKINYCDSCGLAFCEKHGTYLGPPDLIEECFFCARCMDEDDSEILDDEHVIQAIIEKDEHELIKSLEGDRQAIDYFCRHSEGLSEKGKKMLEKMKESILFSIEDLIVMMKNLTPERTQS